MKKLFFPLLACTILPPTTLYSMLLNSLLKTQAKKNIIQKRTYRHQPSTESLCKELIEALKKQDEIVKQLLHPEHTSQLTHYPGHMFPLEREEIISKMKESRRLFHELEEETRSWHERQYGR